MSHGYEAHITLSTADADIGRSVAKEFGWKHSEIARDPLLGDDVYFYLTAHHPGYNTLYREMKGVISYLQCHYNVKIYREKIEHIVYDVRHDRIPAKSKPLPGGGLGRCDDGT